MFRRRFFIVKKHASDDVSVFKSNHAVCVYLSRGRERRARSPASSALCIPLKIQLF